MKNKSNFYLIFFIILLFWKLFIPGPRAANDYPYIYPDALKEAFHLPSTWLSRGGEGMGEYAIFTMWSWPTDFLYGLGGISGLSFDIIERLLGGLLPIAVGVISIRTLLKRYKIQGLSSFVAAFFYLTTTYFILLMDGGQFLIALAYAWLPYAFYLLIEASGSGFKNKLLAAVGVSLLGFCDIRFVYVLFILYAIYFLYRLVSDFKSIRTSFLDTLKTAIIILPVFIGLNFYWILPLVLTNASTAGTAFTKLTQADSLNFTNIGHALFILQPHWFKNIFGKITNLQPEFVLIPFLVFLAPLAKRNKEIGFWLAVALTGTFLTKGSNPPLGQIYTWMFANLPGFSLFRDSTKFFFLTALAYTPLIGFTVQELSGRINWNLKIKGRKISAVAVLILIYFILLIRPVWRGEMTGTFSDPIYKNEFFKLADILKNDINFGRVFWITSRPPLGYSSPTHPSAEALRMVERRPFMVGTVGTYETLNFIREAQYMGELFDIAGIKYIAYPYPDTRREKLSQDSELYYYSFSDQIDMLDWTGEKITDYPLNVYKVRSSKDKFFIAQNTWLVVGSDRLYEEFGDDKYGKLSDNALIFTEDEYNSRRFLKHDFINILNYELAGSIYGPDSDESFDNYKKPLFLASVLTEDPKDNNGWWKKDDTDFLWLRNFLQTKYGIDYQEFTFRGGVAISEGNNKITVDRNLLGSGEYLQTRFLLSPKGGKIKYYQDGEYIGEEQTKLDNTEKVTKTLSGYKEIPDQLFEYDHAEFVTSQVGKLDKNINDLTIETEGDINVINLIATSEPNEFLSEEFGDKWTSGRIYNWDNLSDSEKKQIFTADNKTKVSYERISQTHYKVRVEGLKNPSTLVFSETYDPMWEMNGENSYPLYSFINGFYIERDGDYDIYYKPQKFVLPGLLFTVSTILTLLYLFI